MLKINLFHPRMHRVICALIGICLLVTSLGLIAHAQGNRPISLIRDTEIENYLKEWALPVIKAADLDPASVNIILVQDNNVNAFVAGGQNIFLYTGLLMKSKSPEEVVGVIAHELGHIRGGHLIRGRDAMESASYEAMLGSILGIGVAILSGQGGAAGAIATGSQSMALNKFLNFSRIQESSADQAALGFLERAKQPPNGLIAFMQRLADEELVPSAQQSEYVRTHPLTRDRVESLQAGARTSKYMNKEPSARWKDQHARMLAKLTGFVTPEYVVWNYSEKDTSLYARYARGIAAYRQNKVQEALNLTDSLLKDEPQNPYFLELKGQMLSEFGRPAESVPYYKQAVALEPSSGLIRTAYAHNLIVTATGTAQLETAITQLERAKQDEPRSAGIHRLLATAYGKVGDESMAKLHLAEEALLQRRYPQAKMNAEAAANGLKRSSGPWIRAQDILQQVSINERDAKPENGQR